MVLRSHRRRRRAPRRIITGFTTAAIVLLALANPSSPVMAAGPAAAGSSAPTSGYWMVGSDGHVYPFGSAASLGSPTLPAGARASHIEPSPDGRGYAVLDDRGNVFAFGDAPSLGNAALAPGEHTVSLSATPSGAGYWIFTSAGRVITEGDARNLGDMSGKHLNAPVVSSTVAPDGSGYWMVAADGGVFSFGTPFWGSTGNLKLNKPVEGIVPTVTNKGYWLVAADGGVFAFGDAGFKGSMGATKLNKPVVGLVRYGDGYLMVASDGGIFAFSNLPFQGSLGANPPANPVVGTAAVPAAPSAPASGGPTPPGGTTPTTAPVTLPAGQYPPNFSSSAQQSWGTATDTSTPCYDIKINPPLCFAQMVDSVVEIGDKAYVAGEFTNMVDPSNGLAPASPALPFLAVLDKATWTPDAASPFNTAAIQPDGPVLSLAASADGRTLYVGGKFHHIGGGTSRRVAALDVATGRLVANWTSPGPDAAVNAVALSADGQHLYIGGSRRGGGNIQAFKVGGTSAPLWKVEVDGDATGVAATDNHLYLVGHFGHVAASATDVCPTPTDPTQPVSCDFGNQNRTNHLAAFDLNGKLLGTFTAQANTPKGPEFAYLGAQDLYVGGDFTGVASAPNPNGGVAVYHKQPGLAVYHTCPSAAAC
ncbi:MAG: DUF4988 domain-containing protein [Actinobacteria bacterium]|nr:DUF4988 domain-containing protein [Actinomycetota bacterium]